MTIAPTILDAEAQVTIATWASMGADDDGSPVRYGGAADRTVQVFGTFGGTTVGMQGSLDGTNWVALTDAQGNTIEFTADGLEAITELVRFIRPVTVGGTGVDVTVMLLMRRTI